MGYMKDKLIEQMEPKPHEWERRWIPVGERLPEQREHVIGWGVDFARPAEVWIGGDGAWYGGDFEQAGRITHWMPLPDLPEVK